MPDASRPPRLTFPPDTTYHAEAAARLAQSRERWGITPPGLCRAGDLAPELAPADEGNPTAYLDRRRWHSIFYVSEGRLFCDIIRTPDIPSAASRWCAKRGLSESVILNVCFRRDTILHAYSGGYTRVQDATGKWSLVLQPARQITALVWLENDLCVELSGDVWTMGPKQVAPPC